MQNVSIGKIGDNDLMVLIPLATPDNNNNQSRKYIFSLISSNYIYAINIMEFTPQNGQIKTSAPILSLENYFNNKPIIENGKYLFSTFDGHPKDEIVYSNDKLKSHSYAKPGIKNSNADYSFADPTIQNCIDWFWETTYYWSDGTITHESVYLYTTCNNNLVGGTGWDDAPPTDEPLIGHYTWMVAVSEASGLWGIQSIERFRGVRTPTPSDSKFRLFHRS